jgi:hypothetical protein
MKKLCRREEKKCNCFKDAVDIISVEMPKEPTDINWRNMIEDNWKKLLMKVLTYLLLFTMVGITCLIVYKIRIYQNDESRLIAKLYSKNNITTTALFKLDNWESNKKIYKLYSYSILISITVSIINLLTKVLMSAIAKWNYYNSWTD